MDEPKKPPRPKEDTDTLYCSFCSKSHHEVRKLIAGPKVMICDECIGVCNEIIADEDFERAKETPAKLASYILEQQKAVKATQERIIDAAQTLGASLAPGGDTRH